MIASDNYLDLDMDEALMRGYHEILMMQLKGYALGVGAKTEAPEFIEIPGSALFNLGSFTYTEDDKQDRELQMYRSYDQTFSFYARHQDWDNQWFPEASFRVLTQGGGFRGGLDAEKDIVAAIFMAGKLGLEDVPEWRHLVFDPLSKDGDARIFHEAIRLITQMTEKDPIRGPMYGKYTKWKKTLEEVNCKPYEILTVDRGLIEKLDEMLQGMTFPTGASYSGMKTDA